MEIICLHVGSQCSGCGLRAIWRISIYRAPAYFLEGKTASKAVDLYFCKNKSWLGRYRHDQYV